MGENPAQVKAEYTWSRKIEQKELRTGTNIRLREKVLQFGLVWQAEPPWTREFEEHTKHRSFLMTESL
jgi:hypothetical protein